MTSPKPVGPPYRVGRGTGPDGDRRAGWTVVLPVKGGDGAKSRLRADPGLAAAIAQDCLDAVLGSRAVATVLVVTADPQTATAAGRAGARVVPESVPGAGLNAAVRDGLDAAAHLGAGHCAVLLCDLPALRSEDLTTALREVGAALAERRTAGMVPAVFVPDQEGTGTVLLAGTAPGRMDPAFGPGSARAHADRGALRLDLDLPRLRRDVDTSADLDRSARFGLGPRTRDALGRPARDPAG